MDLIRKMCFFQLKTGHISETVRATAKKCYCLSLIGSAIRPVG